MRVGKPEEQAGTVEALSHPNLSCRNMTAQTSTQPYKLSFGSHTSLRLLAVFCHSRHGNCDTTSVTLGQVAFNQDNQLCTRVKITDTSLRKGPKSNYMVKSSWKKFTYLLTYLLTYSTQHSPSWEANRFAASQEIPPTECLLPHSQGPPPVPILSQINPVHLPIPLPEDQS
jgi:hypothetical protein